MPDLFAAVPGHVPTAVLDDGDVRTQIAAIIVPATTA
jgi:hypothetical protein